MGPSARDASPAAVPRAPPWRSRTAWRRPGWAPTPAVPAASQPRSAASSATSPPRGGSRSPACCRWRHRWTRLARWRPASPAAPRSTQSWQAKPRVSLTPHRLNGLRLAVPDNLVLDGMDDTVAATFDRALSILSAAGARIERTNFAEFAELPAVNAKGGLRRRRSLCLASSAAGNEGQRIRPAHPRPHRARRAHERRRLHRRAERARAADRQLRPRHRALRLRADAERADHRPPHRRPGRRSAPTTASTCWSCATPRSATSSTDARSRCPAIGMADAPVGLMLMGETMGDARLFGIAAAVEAALRPETQGRCA